MTTKNPIEQLRNSLAFDDSELLSLPVGGREYDCSDCNGECLGSTDVRISVEGYADCSDCACACHC